MSNSPLVTIIIPAYNHEKYIQKAITSVIEQTYSNIEFIIINDGSSDQTHLKIMELYDQCDKRFTSFTYINRKNIGLIKTLNEALETTNGTYFSMLGSDDYYEKNKTELQVNFFNKNPKYALCYGNITFIDSEGNITKKGKTKHFKSGYVFNDLLFRCFIGLPSVMINTNITKELGGFDERFFLEDYPLYLKIAKKYKVGFIKEQPLSYYRLHGSNISSNMLNMIKEVETLLRDWKSERYYKRAMSRWYLRWFADLSKTMDTVKTQEYMIKAFPTNWFKIRFIRSFIRYHKNKKAI